MFFAGLSSPGGQPAAIAPLSARAGNEPEVKAAKFPFPEKLYYRVEWRLVTAGSAIVDISRAGPDVWKTSLNLESAGLVTRLYRVQDTYIAITNEHFCPANTVLDAQEGRRHTITHLTFGDNPHRVSYEERDLVKNSTVKKELDIASCTYEITGALAAVRDMSLEPGKSTSLPITDGKKMVHGRIEAQARENLSIEGKSYQTIRYEAFLFDNVLYKRKGRFFMWVTEDANRLPIQFRIQLGFPIGTVTVQLEKEQKM